MYFPILVLLANVVSSVPFVKLAQSVDRYHPSVTTAFKNYVIRYNKDYSEDEFLIRITNFESNSFFILDENDATKKKTYTLGLNEFADMDFDEFHDKHLRAYISLGILRNVSRYISKINDATLSKAVDWVDKGVVTPVKDEGVCGSSWVFSSVGALESAWAIKTCDLISLSDEQLLTCTKGLDGKAGCSGGSVSSALQYVTGHGISRSGIKTSTTCDSYSSPRAIPAGALLDVKWVGPTTLDLKSAIMAQPVSVMVEVSSMSFILYKSGVLDLPSCGTDVNHAVLAVGYGVDNGISNWFLKNSWGDDWGSRGYAKLALETERLGGTCGIQLYAFYPEVMHESEERCISEH